MCYHVKNFGGELSFIISTSNHWKSTGLLTMSEKERKEKKIIGIFKIKKTRAIFTVRI